MNDKTREHHGNPDEEKQTHDTHEYDETIVQHVLMDARELMTTRQALENYRDMVSSAGIDGLDPIAKKLMMVNLQQLKLKGNTVGMESFDVTNDSISVEDFAEWINGLSDKIKSLIDKLIALAKDYASKIMSGVESVKSQAEDLINRARKSTKRPANELHGDDKEVSIDNPSILWANGEFCIGDCRSEQEVVKFFLNVWPKYAKEQISRAKKMVGEYDVETGNSENFEANMGFIGNHQTLVAGITKEVLPGNKQIAFKYVALGPELVDAEDAEPAPAKHSFEVRSLSEINTALKANISTMNALGSLFKAESEVLHDMSSLSEALMQLEGRRGETIWKSARDGLDDISTAMLDLIGRLKPSYDPIVRHLAKVGNARNAICRKELDALGQ